MMLSLIIPIISLLGYGAMFSRLTKTSIGISMPVILSVIISSLYFASMLGFLKILCFASYFGGIGCLIYYCFVEKNLHENLGKYKIEIASLSLICVAYAIYVSKGHLASWDDFTHWGLFSKELIYRDSLEGLHDITSISKDKTHYPRGPAFYHYYFGYLNGSNFSEPIALFSHFLLHIILLLPLACNKKPWQTIALILPLLMIVALYTTGLRSLYNDSTIGLMFASLLSIYILEKDKTKALFLVIPIIILMPLFREVGFWLSIFGSIIICVQQLKFKQLKLFKISKYHFLYMLLLLLPFIINSILTYYYQITHDYWGKPVHRTILEIIQRSNENNITTNFIFKLLKTMIKEGALVVYLFIFASYYWTKKYNHKMLDDYKSLLLSLSIFFIIFVAFRLYLFIATYQINQAMKAQSLERYIGTYALAYAVFAASYIKLSYFTKEAIETRFEKIAILLLSVISLSTIIVTVKRIPTHYSAEEKIYEKQAMLIWNYLKEGKSVEIDASYKKLASNKKEKDNQSLSCYKLNYKLAPFFTEENYMECGNSRVDQSTHIYQQQNFKEVPKNCVVVYQPFLLNIKLKCT